MITVRNGSMAGRAGASGPVRNFIGHVAGPLNHSSHELTQVIGVVNDQEPQFSSALRTLAGVLIGGWQRRTPLRGA